MTLEQLCQSSAAELEAMTDQQLLAFFQPYLVETRPEFVRQRTPTKNEQPKPVLSEKQKQVMLLLAGQGVDVSFMNRRKK